MPTKTLSSDDFIKKLTSRADPSEKEKYKRYFKTGYEEFIGVKMGAVFLTAKEFIDMDLGEVEKLFKSNIHEVRAGALSIISQQAKKKKTTEARLKELYELYLRNHKRINNWDLVDLAAYYVVGRYLEDKPREILYKLASSKNIWERRTSIVATAHFIRQGDTKETFKISEVLLNDTEDLIHKATGWMLRYAGDKDRIGLIDFLNKHASTMPRTALRYSLEHLDIKEKKYFMELKNAK